MEVKVKTGETQRSKKVDCIGCSRDVEKLSSLDKEFDFSVISFSHIREKYTNNPIYYSICETCTKKIFYYLSVRDEKTVTIINNKTNDFKKILVTHIPDCSDYSIYYKEFKSYKLHFIDYFFDTFIDCKINGNKDKDLDEKTELDYLIRIDELEVENRRLSIVVMDKSSECVLLEGKISKLTNKNKDLIKTIDSYIYFYIVYVAVLIYIVLSK